MKFTIEVEGQRELLASFLMVQEGLVDLRQLGTWDRVQTEFYKVLKDQFGSEGAAGKAGKWKPLSPKYAKVKLRKYGALPILQATGKLYRAMTSQGGDSFVEKKAQEMTIGTKLPYAAFHQRGGKRLPQREIISLTDEQEKQITAPIQEKLKQLVANAKLRERRGF